MEVRVTWEPGDAARLTAEAVTDAGGGKIGCIVAGGGDGTINEVFAAAYTSRLPAECSLAVLPLGTANDFARSTGIPAQDLTAALRLAATVPARLIDVGLVDGKPFVNLVSGGFGSRVTVETDPNLKKRLGGLAYAITGISHFAELAANQGTFRAEGFSWEGHFLAVAIGNGRQAGGGIRLCPNALIDDGLLDLTICRNSITRHGSTLSLTCFARAPWAFTPNWSRREVPGSSTNRKTGSTSISMASRCSRSGFASNAASARFP